MLLKNAYLVSNRDHKVLKKSSSGGVFYTLASFYLVVLKGVVYGSTIDNQGNVFHKRVTEIGALASLMKSKYVVSELKNTFLECANDLNNGLSVLFVGTPCQIGALIHYLNIQNIDRTKLLTVDLFCHGTPKKEYWHAYLKELLNDNINNLEVDFRHKRKSFNDYSLYIYLKSKGLKYCKQFNKDPYMKAFLKNYTLMDSCYNCQYKGDNRVSDISIGDFWGCEWYYPELFNKRGTSLIVVNNNKTNVLDILSSQCDIYKVDFGLAMRGNAAYYQSVRRPNDYETVKEKLLQNGFKNTFTIEKQLKNIKTKLKVVAKKLLAKHNHIIIKENDVGIITYYGYSNFGNRLQNYSLRKTIEKMGYHCFNISNSYEQNFHFVRFYFSIKNIIMKLTSYKRERSIRIASKCSGEITIPFSYTKENKKHISLFKNIVLGSDQIWNTNYNLKNIPFHLGLFGTNNINNIFSYAASFGLHDITSGTELLFKSGFEKMANISVRETRGKEIVEELGFNAKLVLDPTLLLEKNEWDCSLIHFSEKNNTTNPYILKYLLNYKEKYTISYEFSQLETIDLLNKKGKHFISNQFDFINYIKNAEVVLTDSFHASAFAVLFGKKLYVQYNNKIGNANSRLDTLFSWTALKGKDVIGASEEHIVFFDCAFV